jgi:hypothetical protein
MVIHDPNQRTDEFILYRFLPAMTRIILQKKFLPASHDDLLLAFQTLDIGMLASLQLTVALNYVITSSGGFVRS